MFRRLISISAILFGFGLLSLPMMVLAQGPVDTGFTYQGRLRKNGAYVDGLSCDFQFSLFDAPSNGTQLGSTLTRTSVAANDGYFETRLDFGDVFTDAKRYLQVGVQCPPDNGFTPMGSRIELNVTPYALYALEAGSAGQVAWSDISGMPAGFADNVDDEGGVSDFACSTGEILKSTGSPSFPWECEVDVGSQPNTVDHGGLLGLAMDDHEQYLLIDGSRPMAGNLDMAVHRITNLITGTADNDGVTVQQAIKVGDGAGGDLASNYPSPSVARLQGFTVSTSAPALGEVLIWDGSQWEPGSVLAEGPAGGDLTGNYPDPLIAPSAIGAPEIAANAVGSSEIAANAVGMSELSLPMGTVSLSTLTPPPQLLSSGANYLGFTSSFVPDSAGSCLVIASASLWSSPGSSADNGAWLRTAKQSTSNGNESGSHRTFIGNSTTSPAVSVSEVWPVSSESTSFGCYVFVSDSSFTDDEFVNCQVSYICQ